MTLIRLICTDPWKTYFALPQWHPRSEEQQFSGSATLPSGPMQVCVSPHQKIPELEAGTVGSGSDQMYWLFQCNAEHSPGRSVLKRSARSLMPHLPPSEWPASLPPWQAESSARYGPDSWP